MEISESFLVEDIDLNMPIKIWLYLQWIIDFVIINVTSSVLTQKPLSNLSISNI